jgi:alanine-glyoxylate transaminase/serine-glyoxylate transaminase/serine-pyruvate transaminase
MPEGEAIEAGIVTRSIEGAQRKVEARNFDVRKQLLEKFNLEIGAGLGPLAGKVWRFGLMGHSARRENVELCLGALADVLSGMGHAKDKGAALAAAGSVYAAASAR